MSCAGVVKRWGIWIVLGAWAIAAPLVIGQEETPKLDVPFVPTNAQAVEEMLKMAKVTAEDFLMDLGCGDGRIVVAAASKYKAKGMGVDLDPQRIKESNENAKKAGVTDMVTFKVADIFQTDVRQASVVTLFLLESVNVQLRPRLFAQLKPGTRVVSNGFSMRDWKDDKTVQHDQAYSKVIHYWVIPAPVGGTWKWQTMLGEKATPGSLKLEQEFQVVRGTVKVGEAAEVPIAEASLSGKELTFTATVPMGEQKVVIAYRGTVDGDSIKGTQEWRGGANAGSHPWLAKRDAADLVGKWQVRSESNADQNGTLDIRRKEGMLSAVYVRDSDAKKEIPVSAFYAWGSSVRFEIASETRTLVFTGSLAPEGGAGSVSPGEAGKPGSWQAKRAAEK